MRNPHTGEGRWGVIGDGTRAAQLPGLPGGRRASGHRETRRHPEVSKQGGGRGSPWGLGPGLWGRKPCGCSGRSRLPVMRRERVTELGPGATRHQRRRQPAAAF